MLSLTLLPASCSSDTEHTHLPCLGNGHLTGRLSPGCLWPKGNASEQEITHLGWPRAQYLLFRTRQPALSFDIVLSHFCFSSSCPEFFSSPWASYLFVLRNTGDYLFKFLAALMPCNFPERVFIGLFEFWPHMTGRVINYCISNELSTSSKKPCEPPINTHCLHPTFPHSHTEGNHTCRKSACEAAAVAGEWGERTNEQGGRSQLIADGANMTCSLSEGIMPFCGFFLLNAKATFYFYFF